jgi:hypothetical protein
LVPDKYEINILPLKLNSTVPQYPLDPLPVLRRLDCRLAQEAPAVFYLSYSCFYTHPDDPYRAKGPVMREECSDFLGKYKLLPLAEDSFTSDIYDGESDHTEFEKIKIGFYSITPKDGWKKKDQEALCRLKIQSDPQHPMAHHHPADYWLDLAKSAIVDSKPHEAMHYLDRALKLHPGEMECGKIAILYQQMKEYHRALQVLDPLLQGHHSGVPERWLTDRGVLEATMGNNAEAIMDLRAAIARAPNFFPAYLTLGSIYFSSGHRADALRTYKTAIDLMATRTTGDVPRLIRAEYERLRKGTHTDSP